MVGYQSVIESIELGYRWSENPDDAGYGVELPLYTAPTLL